MPREIPEWLRLQREGAARAAEALTVEEAAERRAYWAERRAERSQKAAYRAKIALFVNQRLMHGDKPDEIAKETGVSLAALRKRARRWGHALFERKGFRRVTAWVRDSLVVELDAIAAEMEITRDKAFMLLVEDVLRDKAFIARRTLGLRQKKAEAVA